VCHCGQPFETIVDTVLRGNVKSCGCLVSSPQKEIADYVEGLGFEVHRDAKKVVTRKEIDVWIPAANLAIEYNGLYWHSDRQLEGHHGYHADKFKELKDKKIRLLTVFEDEYLEKPEVVKSMIEARLGVTKTKVFARNCILIEDRTKLRAFMEANHLQGRTKGRYLGLEHEGRIVAAMTFRRNQRLTLDGWELSRYCNLVGTSVVGGFSKLLAEFIRKKAPTELVSISDNRWSWGEVYSTNGWEFCRESPPTYYYIKDRKRYHKSLFSLTQLKKLGWFVEGLSEAEIMAARKFDRIYDCGKVTWSLRP
jgi:hypothetical protein